MMQSRKVIDVPAGKASKRKVVGVSLSPEAYNKLKVLGEQLGLSDAGTAKHLIMMSLQSLMGQINQLEQQKLVAQMADAISRDLGELDSLAQTVRGQFEGKPGASGGGPSITSTRGHKCPPDSTSSFLPVHRGKKGGKAK